ncbi:uncharacterized protein [Anomalospiza imberbis]|uniref:uncharacterized protein n=1 Tax=Anomalospiza imberbis TaxID=187417 RepID=UPI00358F5B54
MRTRAPGTGRSAAPGRKVAPRADRGGAAPGDPRPLSPARRGRHRAQGTPAAPEPRAPSGRSGRLRPGPAQRPRRVPRPPARQSSPRLRTARTGELRRSRGCPAAPIPLPPQQLPGQCQERSHARTFGARPGAEEAPSNAAAHPAFNPSNAAPFN